MTKPIIKEANRLLTWFRKYHKWPSLIFAFFIIMFSISGIILNHRQQFSSVDISRNALPQNYRYQYWNLSAVKSQVQLSPDSLLLYGNIGIWKSDSGYKTMTDFNRGFPKGVDNRKINCLIQTSGKRLFAGTLFGLYEFAGEWKRVELPVSEQRIVSLLEKGDSLLVMTRSSLLVANTQSGRLEFNNTVIPAGEDYDNKAGLFKTLWVIHSGEIYGKAGRLLVDAVGLIVLIISISGLFYWLAPHLLKRVKLTASNRIKKVNKFSLKWHNRLGSWAILLLMMTTITGMFLRPPLLIPIANAKVAKIKHSELDNPNPWFDRLRDILYDRDLNRFVLASSEGIYYSDDEFRSPLRKYPVQPPVSVMGITVLDQLAGGDYLVGSFSGLFRWIPAQDFVQDFLTKKRVVAIDSKGPPFGSTAVAGLIRHSSGQPIVFDYNEGAISLDLTASFPEMPRKIIDNSPVSLWNTALEVHTGRIYEFLIGGFYILVVPLTGLALLLILITGFFAWWLPYRRKRSSVNLDKQSEAAANQ